jgi:hypothetical protein
MNCSAELRLTNSNVCWSQAITERFLKTSNRRKPIDNFCQEPLAILRAMESSKSPIEHELNAEDKALPESLPGVCRMPSTVLQTIPHSL